MSSSARFNGRSSESTRLAIGKLFDRHANTLYSLATRLCRSSDEAEDLVQVVFMMALQKWDQFKGRSRPETWLFTIAARACQRHHRRRAGQPERIASLDQLLPFDEERVPAIADGKISSLSIQERKESISQLQQAVAELPESYRLPLVFKDMLSFSMADVAVILGLKINTVKARVHRTRLFLRKRILRTLPVRTAGPPAYAMQFCLDLIRTKQEAMDRGRSFPILDKVICERCNSFFDSMDLTRSLCVQMTRGEMPSSTRNRLRERLSLRPRTLRARAG